jgi:hypothetical protein
MAFELFERRLGRTSPNPTIGLQKKGTLSLNASAFALLMSTQSAKPAKSSQQHSSRTTAGKAGKQAAAYVEFLYDRARGIVGMRIAPSDGRNSYPIRKQPSAESYIVAGKAFFEHHNVELGTLRRFTPRIYDGNIMGFNLSEE